MFFVASKNQGNDLMLLEKVNIGLFNKSFLHDLIYKNDKLLF